MPFAATILNIATYRFTGDERVFIDTSVLLFLFGPRRTREQPGAALYQDAFKRILAAGCTILINPMTISEFIRLYIARAFDDTELKKKLKNIKNLRASAEFVAMAEQIARDVARILRRAEVVGDNWSGADIMEIMEEFARGKSDFNDQVITKIGITRNAIIITHDRDFNQIKGITILTATQILYPP